MGHPVDYQIITDFAFKMSLICFAEETDIINPNILHLPSGKINYKRSSITDSFIVLQFRNALIDFVGMLYKIKVHPQVV